MKKFFRWLYLLYKAYQYLRRSDKQYNLWYQRNDPVYLDLSVATLEVGKAYLDQAEEVYK